MTHPFAIRPARTGDLPYLQGLMGVFYESQAVPVEIIPALTPDNPARRHAAFLVATENDIPVAMARATFESGQKMARIDNVCTSPGHRGRGAASALLAACEEWARAHRLNATILYVEAHNDDALRLYKNKGYSAYFNKMSGMIGTSVNVPTQPSAITARLATAEDGPAIEELQESDNPFSFTPEIRRHHIFMDYILGRPHAENYIIFEQDGRPAGFTRFAHFMNLEQVESIFMNALHTADTNPETARNCLKAFFDFFAARCRPVEFTGFVPAVKAPLIEAALPPVSQYALTKNLA